MDNQIPSLDHPPADDRFNQNLHEEQAFESGTSFKEGFPSQVQNLPEPNYSLQSSASSPKIQPAIVIAIANQKGGVAKTTSVVSLGGALVQRGKEVLLVDLDAQANLTLALGVDPTRMRGAITDVFFSSATLLSVSRETAIRGLDLVPANSGMDLAERFLPVRKNYEVILRNALVGTTETGLSNLSLPRSKSLIPRSSVSKSSATQAYDYIILDCPPFIGAVTLNAMIASNLLIIPTQPEYFSAHALRTMMATIRQVRNQNNPELVYRILVTMIDRRNRIHRKVEEQIRLSFGEGVFTTSISMDTKLRESAVEGLPISHHMRQSRSALQYDALAQELIDYVETKTSSGI